ncbi:MAG TPA: transporter substrate-binding domain-containing protein, partial [Roseiflexaceae bacterium]|nr:transporter substrate-binding domain-containing protein [Roseiflexaceae bacterium]
MSRSRHVVLGLLLMVLALAACGQSGTTGSGGAAATSAPAAQAPAPTAMAEAAPTAMAEAAPTAMAEAAPTAMAEATGAPAAGGDDLLAEVKQRGKLLIATDANYKPQSFKNPDGSFEGFDIDVAKEVAKRLGVEAEFLDISFDIITAGGWNGRWDMNAGSMTITPERKQSLYFTGPYYYTPATFVVHKDSAAASLADLKGKTIGVGAATTYQNYLEGSLTLEGEEILQPPPEGAQVKTYPSDVDALTDQALGDGTRLDAVLTALPTADEAIKGGQPLKIIGDPVYYEDLGLAFDQKSPKDSKSLADAVTKIIEEMHADGTLTGLA